MSAISPAAYFAVLAVTLLALGVLSITAVLGAYKVFDALMERLR